MHKEYYYHSDHLGSASLISDYKGDEYQRIEYTPYGETWVEKTQNQGLEYLPYKFTAKEQDEARTIAGVSCVGLYYYGARYLDAKYSRWLSADPALGDYVSGTEKGEGGIYNTGNFSLYHYAGNNPIKYTDPTEAFDWDTNTIESGDTLSKITNEYNEKNGTNYSYDDIANANGIDDPNKIYAGDKLDFSGFSNNIQTSNDITSSDSVLKSTPSNKTTQIGLGLGVFLVTGLSVEVGISYSKKEGFDIYRTFGVGIAGDVTLAGSYSDLGNSSLHGSTGNTAQIGAGPLLNYDLNNNANFSGFGGIGVGGGVLWTYTRTLKGDIRDIISFFKKASQ
ncbi:RHS repeat-associated core domain-containing protein [Treponema parvum]|uniref:RHS repeat-associated core domain-containing protein n=1 Tax=Treponema parvum TaxID=138851 RepID=UPI001AEBD490|nr:RHS repeat-associated core domain-containing protein [Treponema parvum]QTQ16354.1 LysM peptidoglycan-binding domain-containing protein [Treponema parvum]